MKDLDKLLLSIKMECDRQTKIAEISCFDKIARRSEISIPKLTAYLDELQAKGFIKFSLTDNFIYLTKEGRNYIS